MYEPRTITSQDLKEAEDRLNHKINGVEQRISAKIEEWRDTQRDLTAEAKNERSDHEARIRALERPAWINQIYTNFASIAATAAVTYLLAHH